MCDYEFKQQRFYRISNSIRIRTPDFKTNAFWIEKCFITMIHEVLKNKCQS